MGELVVGELACRRVVLSASWSVGELVCRRVGLSASWSVGELVVGELVCRRVVHKACYRQIGDMTVSNLRPMVKCGRADVRILKLVKCG